MTTPIDIPQPKLTTPDGRGNLEDQTAVNISELAYGWKGDIVGMDADAKKALSEATGSIVQASAALRASEEEARRHEGNLDLHPDGRKARAADARQAGIDKAQEAADNAEVMMNLGEAFLINASTPSMGETRTERFQNRQAATQDIRMVLDATKPGDLMGRIGELAKMDGPIGAVITSDPTWLDLYLTSRGVDARDAEQIRNAAREYAIHARAERGDPNARAIYALRCNLRGALGGTRSSTRRSR
jgi:hypothetical protein